MRKFPAGRLNEDPSIGLSASLKNAGFQLGRLQTGTPARLDGATIDFSKLPKMVGEENPLPFSFLHRRVDNAVCVVLLMEERVFDAIVEGSASSVLYDIYEFGDA